MTTEGQEAESGKAHGGDCRCRDESGKDLGTACPRLSQRSHGARQIRQELAPTIEGRRRTFRRLGYLTQTAAQADLDKVRALLALGEDEDDAEAVSAMLDALDKDEALPDVDTVRRKLRAGQALAKRMTVGEWLDRWTPPPGLRLGRLRTGVDEAGRRESAAQLAR